MREEISSAKNFIDENTKWVYAEEKGVQMFVLYGVAATQEHGVFRR